MNLRFLNNLPPLRSSPSCPFPGAPNQSPNPFPLPPLFRLPRSAGRTFLRPQGRHRQILPVARVLPMEPFRSPSSDLPGRSARKERVEPTGCALQLFRPYVAKVPWHGGARAFLSQLFPRYGHYCGPNWSSGKDGGMPLWDRRPIDWLDFCCYCHDIGYDTHDQAKLLQADLAFLECLERPRMSTKGDAHAAHLYKTMCIAGLRNILIPYRMQLVRMQTGPSFLEVMNSLIVKSRSCSQDSGKGL